jgi:hypothetical protein
MPKPVTFLPCVYVALWNAAYFHVPSSMWSHEVCKLYRSSVCAFVKIPLASCPSSSELRSLSTTCFT